MSSLEVPVSEIFYSIQGEGITAGVPAVFVRLGGCNLLCGGKDGAWVKSGRATWHCDTERVWRNWKMMTMDAIAETVLASLPERMRLDHKQGLFPRWHLVLTGGEPLAYHSLDILVRHLCATTIPRMVEIETNGTLYPSDTLLDVPNIQWNVSPKLTNSGVTLGIRFKPDVLSGFTRYKRYQFKFVVSSDKDVEELKARYNFLPQARVVLMPACDARADLAERTAFVMETAKREGWRCCTRMHVLAWDKLTGV